MELDNAIATPLYKQLEELILDKITNGTLTPACNFILPYVRLKCTNSITLRFISF